MILGSPRVAASAAILKVRLARLVADHVHRERPPRRVPGATPLEVDQRSSQVRQGPADCAVVRCLGVGALIAVLKPVVIGGDLIIVPGCHARRIEAVVMESAAPSVVPQPGLASKFRCARRANGSRDARSNSKPAVICSRVMIHPSGSVSRRRASKAARRRRRSTCLREVGGMLRSGKDASHYDLHNLRIRDH